MIKHLAILGATGAVGKEACRLMKERRVPIKKVTLLASSRGAGTRIEVCGTNAEVVEVTEGAFDGVDYALFSAGGARSQEWAAVANRGGAVVIDNSSAFRMDSGVPLVVPEVNANDIRSHNGIIANPNCSTIIMNMAVWPLHSENRVERIVVSTYQSASGAGAAAMEELRTQSAEVLAGKEPSLKAFPFPIAFNIFSHNTPIGEDGYNNEERKMVDETRKIFHEPDMRITATCIRVPVMRAHSESINLTFERPISPDQVRDILHSAPGVTVVDDPVSGRFPMPVDASGKDDVLVGRIRQDVSQPTGRGIEMFVCGDQIRKGAALNAIQILEQLIR